MGTLHAVYRGYVKIGCACQFNASYRNFTVLLEEIGAIDGDLIIQEEEAIIEMERVAGLLEYKIRGREGVGVQLHVTMDGVIRREQRQLTSLGNFIDCMGLLIEFANKVIRVVNKFSDGEREFVNGVTIGLIGKYDSACVYCGREGLLKDVILYGI